MKVLILSILLLLALAPDASGAVPDAVEPPVYRYLFVFNNSPSMSRVREPAIEFLHNLILGGVQGWIETGDAFGLWTFSDTLNTEVSDPQMWMHSQRSALANAAYRTLRDLKTGRSTKPSTLAAVTGALKQQAELSGTLTAFVITDGSQPIAGTPFDDKINAIFRGHGERMRKAKKAFVVVLVAHNGQWVDNAVSPTGDRVHIPSISREETTQPSPAPPVSTTSPPVETPKPPANPIASAPASTKAARTPSVEEISAILKRQQEEKELKAAASLLASNLALAAAAQTPSNDPGTVSSSRGEASPKIAPADSPAQVPEHPPNAESQAVTPVESSRQDSPTPPPATAAKPASTPAPPATHSDPEIQAGHDTQTRTSVLPALPSESPASSSPAADPQHSATILQPRLASRSHFYLIIGSALLVTAIVLGWLFFRATRSSQPSSIISRSMRR